MKAVWVTLLGMVVAACSASADEVLYVSAASSLTESFQQIEAEFEDANPDVDVVLNLAGSSALREQILSGAPAGVFASADVANMEQVEAAGLVDSAAQVFAVNSLQIAVPTGNPADVTGLEDFSRSELFLGLCAQGVPCGDFARVALERAGVTPDVDTNEPDVRSLLAKIASGDLDAGITYVTDVAAFPDVEGVDIDAQHNVQAEYQIAVVAGGGDPASDFVEFVVSPGGQEILTNNGFATP